MPIDPYPTARRREAASCVASIGRHAARAPAPVRAARRRRDLRQARVAQSRRLGQGSRGAGDDSRRRARRARSRPGAILLDATSGNTGIAYAMLGAARGYPRAALRAGQRHARAQAAAARVRRRPRASPIRWTAATARSAKRGASYAARPGSLLLSRSVQQRRELARALRDDRRRDPRADRRTGHALRRGPRHERHVRRHRPPAARVRPGRSSSSPCSRTRRCTASRA